MLRNSARAARVGKEKRGLRWMGRDVTPTLLERATPLALRGGRRGRKKVEWGGGLGRTEEEKSGQASSSSFEKEKKDEIERKRRGDLYGP